MNESPIVLGADNFHELGPWMNRLRDRIEAAVRAKSLVVLHDLEVSIGPDSHPMPTAEES